MKTTLLTLLVSSLFLTAQAAVDAGKGAGGQAGTKGASTQTQSQMQNQEQMRTQDRLHMQTTADLELKDRVQQQLRTNIKNYDPNKYMVLSQNGEVTLQGIVRTREQAAEMEKEVLRVRGVSRVKNNLVVETQ